MTRSRRPRNNDGAMPDHEIAARMTRSGAERLEARLESAGWDEDAQMGDDEDGSADQVSRRPSTEQT